ncbi:MAG: hypothetical protein JXA37_14590 [Chloroflexia bacterium]|nr:hypothetical protein [Chloroflexia bacterium]
MSKGRLLIVGGLLLCLLSACSGDAGSTAYVWEDLNGDGQPGPNEPAMAGVVIQIVYPSSGELWGRYVTNAEGMIIAFHPGAACGDYDLYLSVPDGYWPTTPVVASPPKCERALFGLRREP